MISDASQRSLMSVAIVPIAVVRSDSLNYSKAAKAVIDVRALNQNPGQFQSYMSDCFQASTPNLSLALNKKTCPTAGVYVTAADSLWLMVISVTFLQVLVSAM